MEKLPLCKKCGHEVPHINNLRLLTIRFLQECDISLGSPVFDDCHIFQVGKNQICTGSAAHASILLERQVSNNFREESRKNQWRRAFERLKQESV